MSAKIKNAIKWLLISTLIGVCAGLLSAFFLRTLEAVTETRESHPVFVWFLPLGGFAVGLLSWRFGKSVEGGNNLILDEIHEPKAPVPFRMIPLILIGTCITHLFGGSAGREGTAVQMGASFADQFTKRFRLSPEERTTLLMAGMSAGFGSVFGVPWAGTLFGIEVLAIGQIRFRRSLECLVASFAGHFTVLAVGVHHTQYGAPVLPALSLQAFLSTAVAGLLFGLAAFVFSKTIHAVQAAARRISFSPLRPLVGGLLVVVGYHLIGSNRYAGLGIPVILESLRQPISALDFVYKSIFTVLTLGFGMKGGEVTPLLFIGASLGNALSFILPVSFSLLAAVGLVAVFAGAANTPLACTLMAMELFGPGIGLFALIACAASWLVSGHHGIYKSQRVGRYKPSFRGRIREKLR